ncbi:MAG TPA: DNA ligase D [Burkholderiales bacterium]|jgi:bifunctional non-homologous end joining protein LigD|nr:DNA ligase D [Burkholderiales bacterium]
MADRLERYREMRDFGITPEPRGKQIKRKANELRYFIQRHAATRLHYDFRLELEGVLKSWAVPKGPSLDPADKRLAVQTEDHPLDYGDFEGVIPEKQYGAGEVLLWDKGVWIPEDRDPLDALRRGRLHFHLDGEKLRGSWVLTRTRGNEDKPAWLLIKRNDENAQPGYEITVERPESVKGKPKPAKYGPKAKLPQFISPELATLVAEPPGTGEWVYEVKHDGYRMLARLAKRDARLFTRSGKDWTERLPHLTRELKRLKLEDSWLDGEIVVLRPDGRSSFQALQNAFDAGADSRIVYYVFDAPYLKGVDQTRLPLAERKGALAEALKKSAIVRFSEHLEGEAHAVLEKACKLGLEGLIGKRADSLYESGRTKTWIKLKCRLEQDFVIAGYSAPSGSRTGFGALLLGAYDIPGGKLHYAGKVGTGFDEHWLKALTKRLKAMTRDDSPLVDPPREKGITWVKPQLVAQIAFAERTDDGILRQASFLGLREDIGSKSVVDERAQKAEGSTLHGIKISHPDRQIWPSLDISKLELARYYDGVGELMLPHLARRPLTLVRCPDGAEKKCFYQRHLAMGASPGDVKTFKRERSSKGYYIYIDSHRALITLVQNGAVEMHTWGATGPDVQHPDRITLDLDPDEDLSWAKLVQATEMTRTIVEALKLRTFLKTTGGKGLHVVVPITPKLGWSEVKEFSRLIAEFLVRAEPKLFTAKMAKERRSEKVFVDYLRNSETASAVAAYSARARPGAGVSMPLAWDELSPKDDVRKKFTVRTPPRKDSWAGYGSTRQSITDAMWKALGRNSGKK